MKTMMRVPMTKIMIIATMEVLITITIIIAVTIMTYRLNRIERKKGLT